MFEPGKLWKYKKCIFESWIKNKNSPKRNVSLSLVKMKGEANGKATQCRETSKTEHLHRHYMDVLIELVKRRCQDAVELAEIRRKLEAFFGLLRFVHRVHHHYFRALSVHANQGSVLRAVKGNHVVTVQEALSGVLEDPEEVAELNLHSPMTTNLRLYWNALRMRPFSTEPNHGARVWTMWCKYAATVTLEFCGNSFNCINMKASVPPCSLFQVSTIFCTLLNCLQIEPNHSCDKIAQCPHLLSVLPYRYSIMRQTFTFDQVERKHFLL